MPKIQTSRGSGVSDQAKDFYSAAVSGIIIAARPLALYYSFMNLVKSFCLTRGHRATFDLAQHGLTVDRHPGTKELVGAFLKAFPSLATSPSNNFAEFKQVLTGTGLALDINYQLPVLLPQIVPGHRVWAMESRKSERFIALHDLRFVQDRASQTMWLDLYLVSDDLTRLGVTHQRLLSEAGLASLFRQVACMEEWNGRPLLRFEQLAVHTYPHAHPADELSAVIDPIRQLLWTTVATATPYRRYYVYLAPTAERPFVLPQLLSIYAIMFYLGSITRYAYDDLAEQIKKTINQYPKDKGLRSIMLNTLLCYPDHPFGFETIYRKMWDRKTRVHDHQGRGPAILDHEVIYPKERELVMTFAPNWLGVANARSSPPTPESTMW